MNADANTLSFLNDESEISDLIKTMNWTGLPVGEPATWPAGLKMKLNTILHAQFPMFIFWGDDMTCFYNDAFRPILGTNGRHPAIGKPGKEVWPELWHFLHPLIEKVKNTGSSVWLEDQLFSFYRNDKLDEVYLTASFSPVTGDDGHIAGVLIVCLETTEKVNLFRQLQETNKLYTFAVDASELGTWDLDPVTNKFIANARLKEWMGLGPDERIELAVATDTIAEKDRARVINAIGQATRPESGGHYDIEYTIIHPVTHQERIVRAKGKTVFNDAGIAYRFNGTLQDITAEVTALEQTKKMSILVENSVDLMAILQPDGRNSYINAAGKELLGIDPDADVTEIPISKFHTPEQLAFVSAEILPSVFTKGKWAGQFGIKNATTGEIIPLYNNCHRIDDERTGEVIGVGTVMRDMRKELNARQQLEDEVKERTKELIRLNEELERKNKELASFAFVSSHDLQEPLRKINTFISRIEEDKTAGKHDKEEIYFAKIKGSVNRMQTLINDLLAFSRTNISELQFETLDLGHSIRETEKDLRERLSGVNGKITYNDLPVLQMIPFQVKQLFTNLISNAIKFARPGIPLHINIDHALTSNAPESADANATWLHIRVSDNGIGFEPQYSDKIFEIFQRLHNRDAYEGTGIGLSICKKIMENHNGRITAEGKPGEGAVFHLYFPYTT